MEYTNAASAGATGRLMLQRRAAPEETHHINNGRGRGVVLELRFVAH